MNFNSQVCISIALFLINALVLLSTTCHPLLSTCCICPFVSFEQVMSVKAFMPFSRIFVLLHIITLLYSMLQLMHLD